MDSLCVVVEFNVLEYLLPSLFGAAIIGILDKLSFQRAIERFHDGIRGYYLCLISGAQFRDGDRFVWLPLLDSNQRHAVCAHGRFALQLKRRPKTPALGLLRIAVSRTAGALLRNR